MIVGLGNPGGEYAYTRHNVGFMVLDTYASDFKLEKKFQAMVKLMDIDGVKCILVKPFTYMNESGISVQKIVQYYDIKLEDILIIHDDMDLPLGDYRLKCNSSSGGHNGIKSIINHLGTQDFARLKVGISHDRNMDTINYVLGKFGKSEMQIMNDNMTVYHDIINSFISVGIAKTMNKFNTK